MDMISYLMGQNKGRGTVEIESDTYVFTDPDSDGNIVITAAEEE